MPGEKKLTARSSRTMIKNATTCGNEVTIVVIVDIASFDASR